MVPIVMGHTGRIKTFSTGSQPVAESLDRRYDFQHTTSQWSMI
jgi:hypothetical protein